jgi:hypothetical protein
VGNSIDGIVSISSHELGLASYFNVNRSRSLSNLTTTFLIRITDSTSHLVIPDYTSTVLCHTFRPVGLRFAAVFPGAELIT